MIPIVLAADIFYTLPLLVVIGSIMIHAKPDTRYEIIILTDGSLEETRIQNIRQKFRNLEIKIIQIDEGSLKEAKINNEGLSLFTYCRIFIPEILADYDKCIYLDTDIVVLDDLADLFQQNIEDYYVAGVKDYGLQTSGESGKNLLHSLQIDSLEKYVNAGVLLMNLKKMREDRILESFKAQIGKKWIFEDQDIINKCCYEKISFLPVRYNLLYRYYRRVDFWENGFYPEGDVLTAGENPAVIHYTGRNMKPWRFIRDRAAGHWWSIADKVLTVDEYNGMYERAKAFDSEMQWRYITEKCQEHKVIIWGAFELGAELRRWLLHAGISVKCFCDNDETKTGMELAETKVESLEAVLAEENVKDYVFLIASQKHCNAIEEQLKRNGIENIIRFFYKTEFYYMALDEAYFEDELAEIEMKEGVERGDFTKEIIRKYWMDLWVYGEKKEDHQ